MHLVRIHYVVKIFGAVKYIWKAEGMVGFIISSKTRCGYLCHGDNACHQLLHIFIFRSQLSVWEDLDLDSSICTFLYLICKLSHCNMDCMSFTKTVGKCKYHWIFSSGLYTVFNSALSTACKTAQRQSYSGYNCCQFFHFILSPFFLTYRSDRTAQRKRQPGNPFSD